MHVSCWVTLRLEKCVEVPERTLDEPVCWHFFEAHTQEDFFELFTNLHERMAMASMTHWSLSIEIVFLEGFIFPFTCPQHFCCYFCFQILFFDTKIWTFSNTVSFVHFYIKMFSLFVVIDLLLFMSVRIGVLYELIQLLLIHVNWLCSNPFKLITILLDPFLFHGFSESDLGNLCSNATFHLRHVNFLTHFHLGYKLELRRSIGSIALSLISQLDNFSLNNIEDNVLESD